MNRRRAAVTFKPFGLHYRVPFRVPFTLSVVPSDGTPSVCLCTESKGRTDKAIGVFQHRASERFQHRETGRRAGLHLARRMAMTPANSMPASTMHARAPKGCLSRVATRLAKLLTAVER